METKENVEVKNQPTVEEATMESKAEKDSITEHISEKPDKSEDIIKSQTGQIQALQKKITELEQKSDVKSILKELLGDEKIESDVDPVQTLKNRIANLEERVTKSDTELAQSKAELQKNAYIDSLDVDEAIKKVLRAEVPITDDLENVVNSKLEMINGLISSIPSKVVDSRPHSLGSVKGDVTDANYILQNPDKFKQS